MMIEEQQSDQLTLRLGQHEIDHWSNALNEVCHGFRVANFQAAIGIPLQAAFALLDRVHGLAAGTSEVFRLDELIAIRDVLTTVLAELDTHEFHTRMGFTVEESRQMRDTLDRLVGQARLVRSA